MNRNSEIKAKVCDAEKFECALRKLCVGTEPETLKQHDVFFNVPDDDRSTRNRLKLRMQNDGTSGELISYKRADTTGPKTANFCKVIVSDADKLRKALAHSLGELGEVKKVRQLYIVGPTRIHVDSVENLGSFMELEVNLTDEQASEDGQQIAKDVMTQLGIEEKDLVSGAYMDLLLQQ